MWMSGVFPREHFVPYYHTIFFNRIGVFHARLLELDGGFAPTNSLGKQWPRSGSVPHLSRVIERNYVYLSVEQFVHFHTLKRGRRGMFQGMLAENLFPASLRWNRPILPR